MSKNHALRFNKIVTNLLTDLQEILPEEKDIRVFKSQVSTIEFLDESKILKSFIKFGYPYKEEILNKKEKFFLKEGNVSAENDYMSESIHLRDLWKNKLSPENKEVVWKYFQVMIVLADKYLAK